MTASTVPQEQEALAADEAVPPDEEQHQPWQGEDAPDECMACGQPWPCEGASDEARALAETLVDVDVDDDPYRFVSTFASRLVVYRDRLTEELHDALRIVGEGTGLTAQDLEGVRVITHKDLELALRMTPFPRETAHHASVRSPATIDIDGVCHDCGEITPLSMAIDTKYISDDKKREMQVTAKGTHGSHRHGQMALAVTPDPVRADGQQSLEDILEGTSVRVDADDDAFADHEDDEPEDDDAEDGDLLPGEVAD